MSPFYLHLLYLNNVGGSCSVQRALIEVRRNIQTHIKTKEKKLVEKMTAYNDIQLTIVHTVCVSILFYFFHQSVTFDHQAVHNISSLFQPV